MVAPNPQEGIGRHPSTYETGSTMPTPHARGVAMPVDAGRCYSAWLDHITPSDATE